MYILYKVHNMGMRLNDVYNSKFKDVLDEYVVVNHWTMYSYFVKKICVHCTHEASSIGMAYDVTLKTGERV